MVGVDALDPREVAERGLRLSGMEYVQAIFNGELPPAPIIAADGLSRCLGRTGTRRLRDGARPAALQPDRIRARRNRATLLDSAMGCAVHTTLARAADTRRSR